MSFRLRFGIRAACMNGGLNKELSRLGCSSGVRMPPPLEKPTKTQYASIIIYIDPIKKAGILRIKGSTVIQKKIPSRCLNFSKKAVVANWAIQCSRNPEIVRNFVFNILTFTCIILILEAFLFVKELEIKAQSYSSFNLNFDILQMLLQFEIIN